MLVCFSLRAEAEGLDAGNTSLLSAPQCESIDAALASFWWPTLLCTACLGITLEVSASRCLSSEPAPRSILSCTPPAPSWAPATPKVLLAPLSSWYADLYCAICWLAWKSFKANRRQH